MMNADNTLLKRLQDWYASMCNDDWEHTYGIFISNIDNPGWSFKVELQDTYLEDVQFKKIQIQRQDENDWIICMVDKNCFQGYGGPCNLNDLLETFLDWAEETWNEI
ncbi:immunity 53 family protein [Terasakiella pusilla]|uniref:immunity 53 family protein n=1 Tax=Terasakiella pusilla TaxID=64973 RepID=UPI003AA87641